MSFTKSKFAKLSKDNRIKKAIFAINDYILNKKEVEYPKTLLLWLEEFDNLKFEMPNNTYSWGILLARLQSLVKIENSFLEEVFFDEPQKERTIFPITVILNDIRSPFNVGAIFRTAESFGVSEIILSGITPTPETNTKVFKTSKSAEVCYSYTDDIIAKIKELKQKGVTIFSLEKSSNSKSIKDVKISKPICLVVGNEEFGVQKEILELSNEIVHITLFGKKNSINVAVATGIALNILVD